MSSTVPAAVDITGDQPIPYSLAPAAQALAARDLIAQQRASSNTCPPWCVEQHADDTDRAHHGPANTLPSPFNGAPMASASLTDIGDGLGAVIELFGSPFDGELDAAGARGYAANLRAFADRLDALADEHATLHLHDLRVTVEKRDLDQGAPAVLHKTGNRVRIAWDPRQLPVACPEGEGDDLCAVVGVLMSDAGIGRPAINVVKAALAARDDR